ncbi:hypothetical protein M9458_052564, partial [Cirrhinus mrigala]
MRKVQVQPAASDYLHWYRQYGRKPEFLVLTYSSAKEAQRSDVDPRISVKVEKRDKSMQIWRSPLLLYQTLLCTTVL